VRRPDRLGMEYVVELPGLLERLIPSPTGERLFAAATFVSRFRTIKVDPIVIDRSGDVHSLPSLAYSRPPSTQYGHEWRLRRHWEVDGWLDEEALVVTRVDGSDGPLRHARTEIGYLPLSEPGPVFRLMRRGDG
jgi:hypothetical protein